MEITVQETVTSKVEIKLPYFSKNICFAYKIISENKIIEVMYTNNPRIEVRDYCVDAAFKNECVEITEAEFMEKFNEVSEILKQSVLL